MTSYFAINLACLGLDLASAPNFRPTFKHFSWLSSLLGLLGCAGLMFALRPLYALGAALACCSLVVALHLLSPAAAEPKWGSLSQALIFHQVRKYLLLLDPRREHVKFWRPQMLLLIASPRQAAPLIDFVNDQKKNTIDLNKKNWRVLSPGGRNICMLLLIASPRQAAPLIYFVNDQKRLFINEIKKRPVIWSLYDQSWSLPQTCPQPNRSFCDQRCGDGHGHDWSWSWPSARRALVNLVLAAPGRAHNRLVREVPY
ncbi:hypothetical protein evm_015022 [Chilo suppressalis]|nr:hypothetical protein evm_015022 [Chilo suppressalis]